MRGKDSNGGKGDGKSVDIRGGGSSMILLYLSSTPVLALGSMARFERTGHTRPSEGRLHHAPSVDACRWLVWGGSSCVQRSAGIRATSQTNANAMRYDRKVIRRISGVGRSSSGRATSKLGQAKKIAGKG